MKTSVYNVLVTPLVLCVRAPLILVFRGVAVIGYAVGYVAERWSALAARLPAWKE